MGLDEKANGLEMACLRIRSRTCYPVRNRPHVRAYRTPHPPCDVVCFLKIILKLTADLISRLFVPVQQNPKGRRMARAERRTHHLPMDRTDLQGQRPPLPSRPVVRRRWATLVGVRLHRLRLHRTSLRLRRLWAGNRPSGPSRCMYLPSALHGTSGPGTDW